MIPYSIVPPEQGLEEEAGLGPPGPDGEAPSQAEGPAELFLGYWAGTPVWVEGYVRMPGRLVVRRLISTAPELYLWAALAPGRSLPLA